jgi:hypothetical protein
VPGRDAEFETKMKAQIGEERWLREFCCICATVDINLELGGHKNCMTIGNLYNSL